MRKKRTTDRLDDDLDFRCHKCGARNRLEVVRTERDEENQPLRIRQCRNCQTFLATEESVIPLEEFYIRNESHRRRSSADWRKKFTLCKFCKDSFPIPENMTLAGMLRHPAYFRNGSYRAHTQRPSHVRNLKTNPTAKERAQTRKRMYVAYWKKRGIDIETAGMDNALRGIHIGLAPGMIDRVEDSRYDR